MGALLEDLCIYLKISRLIILRVRNVPDVIFRENQNTFYV